MLACLEAHKCICARASRARVPAHMLREALLCACLRAGGAHAGLRVRATSLHIGVPRSLRGSVPRDVQVRACVPRGSRVNLRACMPMPACRGRAHAGAGRACARACVQGSCVRTCVRACERACWCLCACVRASERVGVCGPLFIYSLSLSAGPLRPAHVHTSAHTDHTCPLCISRTYGHVHRCARARICTHAYERLHVYTD